MLFTTLSFTAQGTPPKFETVNFEAGTFKMGLPDRAGGQNSRISYREVHDPITFSQLQSYKTLITTHSKLWLCLGSHFLHLYACAIKGHLETT